MRLRAARSVESRVGVLVAPAALAVALVGASAWTSVASLAEDTRRLHQVQQVLSAQQSADMLHDEVRGDVLASLTGGEQARLEAVRSAQALGTAVEAMDGPLAPLDVPGLRDQYVAARAAVQEYVTLAGRVVHPAGGDPEAARAALPAFEEAFVTTADRLAAVTEQLAAEAEAVRRTAAERAVDQQLRTGAVVLVALALLAALATGIRRSIRATLTAQAEAEGEIRRVNDRLREDADERAFESSLEDAFDMALSEDETGEVVRRAVRDLVPGRRAELLLADNSRAHLAPLMVEPTGSAPGCSVTSPGDCVAVRRGRPLVFGSSEDLGACPRLRGRGAAVGSAVCAPVTFLGEGLGVLHVAAEDPGLTGAAAEALRRVAEGSGNRIGTLRAFRKSQLQASTDGLTGLLNRRAAEERVRQLQRSGGGHAVVLADLDRFKSINDTFGHEAGDRALRLFARVLRSVLRADDVLARHGGEEFLLVMPDCQEAPARAALERLREELALAVLSAGSPPFTASFGLTVMGAEDSVEDAVRVADQALLQAKREGRDRVVVADSQAVTAPSA